MDAPEHVGESRPKPRRFRVSLRGLMLLIAFFALGITVVIQTFRLREAQAREQRLRAQMDAMQGFVQTLLASPAPSQPVGVPMAGDTPTNPMEGEP